MALQTKESDARHKALRTERQRVYYHERRARERESAIKALAVARERFATDQEYRERRRAYQRDSRLSGGFIKDAERRKATARAYYVKNKSESNRKRSLGRQASAKRKNACEICELDDPRVLCVHHKIPLSKGGTNDDENLQTLCANCHKIVHFEMGGR